MAVEIKDVDHGYEALRRRVFGFGDPKLSVGILEGQGGEEAKGSSGATLLEIAIDNEFGTDRIPARSFVRAWFDESKAEIKAQLRNVMIGIIKGKLTKEQALERVGLWAAGQMQARIARGIAPPNAEATVRQKGSSTPLIATGQLRGAISYKVEP